MRHLTWHPDDSRWLRRWLRSHLVCTLAIMGFLVLVRIQSPHPHELQARASHQIHLEVLDATSASNASAATPLPPETELRYLSSHLANPIPPTGWRRTDQGWEDVSTWRKVGRPLGEIVLQQQARESSWLQSSLAKLRQVPPLAFALLQIAAISAIVGISRTERREEIKPVSFPH